MKNNSLWLLRSFQQNMALVRLLFWIVNWLLRQRSHLNEVYDNCKPCEREILPGWNIHEESKLTSITSAKALRQFLNYIEESHSIKVSPNTDTYASAWRARLFELVSVWTFMSSMSSRLVSSSDALFLSYRPRCSSSSERILFPISTILPRWRMEALRFLFVLLFGLQRIKSSNYRQTTKAVS